MTITNYYTAQEEQRKNRVSYYSSSLRIKDIFFLLFITYVFISGTPFESRDINDVIARQGTYEQGNLFRQVFYILFFASSSIFVLFEKRNPLKGVSFWLYSLMLLSAISVFWAVNPDVAVRRLTLSIIFVFIIANFYQALGLNKMLDLIAHSLIFLTVAGVICVILVPGLATHPSSELDQNLVGAWRGLFVHKNHAAAACALGIILFGNRLFFSRKRSDLLWLALCILFLIGTKGKTALGFAFPCLIASALFSTFARRRKSGLFLFAITTAFLLAAIILALSLNEYLIRTFSDPMSFTGRVAIWTASLRYISDHMWTGSGYGSFWQIGDTFLLDKYTAEHWLSGTLHAHNGYMEILLMLGYPGLFITLIATIIAPMYGITKMNSAHYRVSGLLFGWLLFAIFFNLLEAQIFTKDWQVWAIMVVVAVAANDRRWQRDRI